MARKLQPETAAKLFLAIGIVGMLLVVGDAVLILLFPSMPGPYFTTVSGMGLILAGFLAYRAIKKDSSPK